MKNNSYMSINHNWISSWIGRKSLISSMLHGNNSSKVLRWKFQLGIEFPVRASQDDIVKIEFKNHENLINYIVLLSYVWPQHFFPNHISTSSTQLSSRVIWKPFIDIKLSFIIKNLNVSLILWQLWLFLELKAIFNIYL